MLNESCSFYQRFMHTPGDTARKLFYYVQWVGHFICKPDFHIIRRNFSSILIIYTLSGNGLLEYRDKRYTLGKNSLMIINCFDVQEYRPSDDGEWNFEFIHFAGSTSADFFNYIYDNYGPVLELDGISPIPELIGEIIEFIRGDTPETETRVSAGIYKILTELPLAASNIGKRPAYDDGIWRVREYIKNNYKSQISVSDMADIACLSRCHFSTIFKRITRVCPHEYLTNFRLNKAKTLLCDTSLSLADIAFETGFSDQNTFIRIFRKIEDITPHQYRKYFSDARQQIKQGHKTPTK